MSVTVYSPRSKWPPNDSICRISGCYSNATCSGNHGLKWTVITSTTSKALRYCSKCGRIFKLKNGLFQCKKCRYSLCSDCYRPSLSVRKSFDGDHKEDVGLFTDDEEDDNGSLRRSQSLASAIPMDEEKRSGMEHGHCSSRSNSLRPMDHGHGSPGKTRISAKSKKSKTKSTRTRARGTKSKQETPSLSLSATSSVNLALHHEQQLNEELSSSLDFSGLESCAPSEITRVDFVLTECVICMERDKNVAFLPCGHYIACEECAKLLQHDIGMCAICSAGIESVLRIYE